MWYLLKLLSQKSGNVQSPQSDSSDLFLEVLWKMEGTTCILWAARSPFLCTSFDSSFRTFLNYYKMKMSVSLLKGF